MHQQAEGSYVELVAIRKIKAASELENSALQSQRIT
jgi:hypothetical protein